MPVDRACRSYAGSPGSLASTVKNGF
ncbi:expressed unknown protein [Ectocarpus siliculosus]|uniref:Uncharacterized protein n=1 Tax=Ectocarpus siliculosus TaxID=2880 RepID=D8LGU2_ECTSI|nr:expressed unknown protein [Ectocarpus siliculosus]|eukprot:CBN75795.1 expressed unknown protein [Ectocarpus siliculosus]